MFDHETGLMNRHISRPPRISIFSQCNCAILGGMRHHFAELSFFIATRQNAHLKITCNHCHSQGFQVDASWSGEHRRTGNGAIFG